MVAEFHAQAYGLRLATPWPILPGVRATSGEVDVRFRLAPGFTSIPRPIATMADGWYRADLLPGGRVRIVWPGLFDCLVSGDGRDVEIVPLVDEPEYAFTTHLFGHVLSFALLRKGLEPLHSTVLDYRGAAIGILGDSGYGKSTLAAALLRSDCRLMTDDLLVLHSDGDKLLAQPGLPRLKLWPEAADRFFPAAPSQAVAPGARKRILALDSARWVSTPAPLRVLYVLQRPAIRNVATRVSIRRLTPAKAFVELARNTFNAFLVDPERMRGQFSFASDIAARTPMRSLTYPAGFDHLPRVVERILEDASSG